MWEIAGKLSQHSSCTANTKNEQSSFFPKADSEVLPHFIWRQRGAAMCFQESTFWSLLNLQAGIFPNGFLHKFTFFLSQKIFPTAESQHLKGNLALHLNCEKSSCFHTNVTESSHGLEGITSMDGTQLNRIFLFWFWYTSLEYSSLVPKQRI